MRLIVSVEIYGTEHIVGEITGKGTEDAVFCYCQDYLNNPEAFPISLSLPLIDKPFSAQETKSYFEGLLPEGFTRRTVASYLHASEDDYLKILYSLGKECLGSIRVVDSENDEEISCSYERLTLEQVRELAKEGASKSAELVTKSHLSLTGASGKVGLYYNPIENSWYLPMGSAPSTHIVKQSHVRLNAIVANEQLSLLTAKKLGIEVPNVFVINTGTFNDEDVLLATERYDRLIGKDSAIINGNLKPFRLHQEDFAQALGIPSVRKYETSEDNYLKSMFELIRKYSGDPISDQEKLWRIIIFNYLLGNTDAHIKNFSLLRGENPQKLRLAPAYDLVSTIVYSSSTRNMAFRVGDEYSIDKIDTESFKDAAKVAGLREKYALNIFEQVCYEFKNALIEASCEIADSGYTEADRIKNQILSYGGIKNFI